MKLLHEPVRNKQWLSAGEKHLSMPGAQETSSTQVGFQAAVWGFIIVNGTKAEKNR